MNNWRQISLHIPSLTSLQSICRFLGSPQTARKDWSACVLIRIFIRFICLEVDFLQMFSAALNNLATTWENISLMCAQWRLKSACALMHCDQKLCCPYEGTLHPWLSKICPLKICAVSSESSLGARLKVGFLMLQLIFWKPHLAHVYHICPKY